MNDREYMGTERTKKKKKKNMEKPLRPGTRLCIAGFLEEKRFSMPGSVLGMRLYQVINEAREPAQATPPYYLNNYIPALISYY